jgi:hypothetical protein
MRQKLPLKIEKEKSEEISCFEKLVVLKASPLALTYLMEA